MDLFQRIVSLHQTKTIQAYSKIVYPDDFEIPTNDDEEKDDEENDDEVTIQNVREDYCERYDKDCYHQFRKTKTYHVPSYREEMKYFQLKNPELAFKF